MSSLFNELIVKSWWLILFFLILFFAYDRTIYMREKEEKRLASKKQALLLARKKAIAHQEELQSTLDSLKDPAWIELVLMRKSGLVPEGQTKIVFVPEE